MPLREDFSAAARIGRKEAVLPLRRWMVVETRLILKEELHSRKRLKTETIETPVTLRKIDCSEP
jgi:hypothetical protein